MKKVFFILFVLVLILIASLYALNVYIYNEKQATPEEIQKSYEPYRATLSGEYVCLPHVDGAVGTKECVGGIKTEVGEYYAVDMNLISQNAVQLNVGEHFTASGTITPSERLNTDQWRQYPIIGIFSITDSFVVDTIPKGVECDADAKICPDGSSVGRTGPKCEFTPCPSVTATSSQVTTYVGGTVTALRVTVSPQEVISDSRCPADVVCVWAGTVEVRTTLATEVAHGEHVLTLGKSQIFGDYTVTLVGVTPNKTQDTITNSSYRFTFEVVKNE